MKQKLNLVSIIALIITIVCLGALAIPGIFATIQSRAYSGYETLFHVSFYGPTVEYLGDNTPNAHVSAAGIICLILMVLAIVCLATNKKSSVLPLLGGILLAIAGIMFLMMYIWLSTVYKTTLKSVDWLTYVIGALLIVSGGALIFFSIKVLLEEKNVQGSSKKTYNYLKGE